MTDFTVKNEPVFGYLAGSTERDELSAALAKYQDVTEDIPIVIGGKEYRTDDVRYQPMVITVQLDFKRNLCQRKFTSLSQVSLKFKSAQIEIGPW